MAYWRARAMRFICILAVPLVTLQTLAMLVTHNDDDRVPDMIASIVAGVAMFFFSARGPRHLLAVAAIVLPLEFVQLFKGCYYGSGIIDPGAFAAVFAVLLGALLAAEWGVVLTALGSVAMLSWVGWATENNRLHEPLQLPPRLHVQTVTQTNITTVVTTAVIMLLVGVLLRRLIALRKVADERAAELSELDEAKTVFLQNMSHEFRQPITLVLAPIEDRLRQTDKDPPDLRRVLSMARRNLRRLLRMVGALLDVAALQAGGVAMALEPQDLAALTRALASEFVLPVQAAGLTLHIDCPTMAESVWVDRRMWETVVMNLLSNALKFTLRGEIAVSLRQVGDEVELRVRDSGCGIAKADQGQLFQRFRRLRTAQARSHEGSGIGLALCADLVKAHGGRIGVESEAGAGATFWVRLPLRPRTQEPGPKESGPQGKRRPSVESLSPGTYVDEAMSWVAPPSGPYPVLKDAPEAADGPEVGPAPAGAAQPAAEADPRPAAAPVAPGKDRRPLVLLADDNGDMRSFLAEKLGERWRVRAVVDGQAALEAIEQELPDLVLSDVMMPRLDGIELVKELRRRPRTAGLPVILISARASHGNAIEGLEARADDYIIKPFAVPELLARVRVHLELSLLRREAAQKQDRFVKMLVHELRGPLTVIKGSTDLVIGRMARADKESESAGLLRHAAKGVTRLEGILSELADAARIEAGGLVLSEDSFDLAELCIEVADEQEMGSDRQVVAEVPAGSVMVHGDRDRIGQVLGNLIGNSIKYDPSGKPIRVTLRIEGAEAVVAVRDHGIGIPEADLERVFEANYRTAEAQKLARGVGLGLFICKHIMDLHGGRIYARREEPGTSFAFTLRLCRAPSGLTPPPPSGAAAAP